MQNLFIKDILKVAHGKLVIGDKEDICEDFSKDTRIIKKDDTYIGIKGEKFDGNEFWKEALQNGAKTVIVQKINFEKEDLEKFNSKNIILVDDTLKALYEIARYKRSLYNIPVVGVTGSVGKTSTKDIIASVLSKKYKTLKTEGNNNNNIGLPFTILKLKDHEAAVIEMGMNHFNEISLLTSIAKPTVSVITNIGTSHIGNLGSRENILKAKLEILQGMDKKMLVINNDNDLLHEWYLENKHEVEIKTYGINNESELMAKNIDLEDFGSNFSCVSKQESFGVSVPIGGEHFVYNALCATLVGKILGLNNEEIKEGIKGFELTKKRMDIDILSNGVKVINDSYNASFESMKASLKYLGEFKENRKIAVLGDMFELGEFSKDLHEKVGKEVQKNNIDILFCTGDYAKFIASRAELSGMKKENVYYFKDKEEIVFKLKELMLPNDVILFKASNAVKLFEIVEKLKKQILSN